VCALLWNSSHTQNITPITTVIITTTTTTTIIITIIIIIIICNTFTVASSKNDALTRI
jgi:hypothetical protein